MKRHAMPASDTQKTIAALDIGSAKIMVAVAATQADGQLRLLGLGHAKSEGILKGQIEDMVLAGHSIAKALKEAEIMAGCSIGRVTVGITGEHTQGVNAEGAVPLSYAREVRHSDMQEALRIARTDEKIAAHDNLLLEQVQAYAIDGERVRQPLGMRAHRRLKVQVHLVKGKRVLLENIIGCVRRCGLEVADPLVHNAHAASRAVLSANEREMGVALLDMGAGTCDFTVIIDDMICHTGTLARGGEDITKDISRVLSTPPDAAEDIKVERGCAKCELADPDAFIEVPALEAQAAPSRINQQSLSSCSIEPLLREVFEFFRDMLDSNGYSAHLNGGIVLTGGAAAMPGMAELAAEIFARPVRVGMAQYGGPLADMVAHPHAACVMGLLQEAHLARLQVRETARKNAWPTRLFYRMRDLIARHL